MKIHREGYRILIVLFIISISVWVFTFWTTTMLVFSLSSLAFLILLLLVLNFFRSPDRICGESDNELISPADGKIVFIDKVFEKEYFQKEMLKISIFMSIWDVHLNRVAVNGVVSYQRYHPGKYLLAINPKSSELNERNSVVIKTKNNQEVLIRQIAGILARRICPYLELDQKVKRGEELGFIRFGSRVDIFMEPDSEVLVNLGDKVRGNLHPVARLK
jgi:phosphatidylserine decarboxylase